MKCSWVTLENNRLVSQEKSKTFALSRLFGPEVFRYKKQYRKKYFGVRPDSLIFLARVLIEEIQPDVLESMEFDYQDKSHEYKIFGIFGPSEMHCGEGNATTDSPLCFSSN